MDGSGKQGWRRVARLAGGWALIVAGLIGLLLPIAPGIPFLLAGLALLAADYPWARRWQDWLKARVDQFRSKPAHATASPDEAAALHVVPRK